MNRQIFIIAILAPAFCLGQQPNGQAGAGYDPRFIATFSGSRGEARIIVEPGIPMPTGTQFQEALHLFSAPVARGATRALFQIGLEQPAQESERAMRIPYRVTLGMDPQFLFPQLWQQALREPATQPNFGGGRGGRGGGGGQARGRQAPDPVRDKFFELVYAEFPKLHDEFLQQLRTFVRSEPAMSAQDRARHVVELDAKIDSVKAQIDVLQHLTAAQPDAAKRLAEKVQQLYDNEQNLQMRLAGLQARRDAIQRGLSELNAAAAAQRRSDPVIDEMRKIADLRQQQLQRTRDLAATGAISQTEVATAEAALAESRLRLLEREDALGKGGKGELMDRLTDELAMVSIDTTDLELQLARLREEIAKTDPAKLNAESLAALIKREPGLGPKLRGEAMPPLRGQLERQLAELRLEWLKIVVADVETIDEPAVQ